MLLVVITLLSCLWFLIVSISVITLIPLGTALVTALLLIVLVILKLVLRVGGADGNVHHIAVTRLLLIGLLIIVVVQVGGLVFSVVGHAAGILWLIISSSTDSPIPVIALFLIIQWPEVTDAVAAKHALLIVLRAEFTFTSAALLRGLTLHIWLLLVVVKVSLGVGLLMRVRRV